MGAHTVDAAGDDEGKELLARPQGPRLEHTRHGQTAVPGGQVHQQLHHVRLYTGTTTQSSLTKSDGSQNSLKIYITNLYSSDSCPELIIFDSLPCNIISKLQVCALPARLVLSGRGYPISLSWTISVKLHLFIQMDALCMMTFNTCKNYT